MQNLERDGKRTYIKYKAYTEKLQLIPNNANGVLHGSERNNTVAVLKLYFITIFQHWKKNVTYTMNIPWIPRRLNNTNLHLEMLYLICGTMIKRKSLKRLKKFLKSIKKKRMIIQTGIIIRIQHRCHQQKQIVEDKGAIASMCWG